MSKNTAEIEKLEEQIAKLKAEDDAFNALTPEQQLAITLHDLLCRHNHADGCGWYYEISKGIHDWAGSAHGVYMQKALKLRCFCNERGSTTETAIDLFRLIKDY
jgi:hypothetical protein